MNLSLAMTSAELVDLLSDATDEIMRTVRRSLVVLHNGHHGLGAGIILDARPGSGAYILTNAHVVAASAEVRQGRLRAELEDGRQFPTRHIADDAEIDLAILHMDAEELYPICTGDSRDLRVGQLVWAVGHPGGQRGVATAGLISSLTKASTRGPRSSVDVIRSDARLAPGNSGGPLVDASGAVIGINTMIVGGDQGIAIPIHLAVEFAGSVLKGS